MGTKSLCAPSRLSNISCRCSYHIPQARQPSQILQPRGMQETIATRYKRLLTSSIAEKPAQSRIEPIDTSSPRRDWRLSE